DARRRAFGRLTRPRESAPDNRPFAFRTCRACKLNRSTPPQDRASNGRALDRHVVRLQCGYYCVMARAIERLVVHLLPHLRSNVDSCVFSTPFALRMRKMLWATSVNAACHRHRAIGYDAQA